MSTLSLQSDRLVYNQSVRPVIYALPSTWKGLGAEDSGLSKGVGERWGERIEECLQMKSAEMADRGEDVSPYFSNKGKKKYPSQRVNVDFNMNMLEELDDICQLADGPLSKGDVPTFG